MPAPLLPEWLWLIVEPLLPPALSKPKGRRSPVPARAALTGIPFVLRTGIPWDMLPLEMGGQQLWDAILRTGADEGVSAHFVGSII